jgi:hypothetical protein
VGELADLPQRVDGAGVDVAGLRADDRRPVPAAERLPQRSRPHAALLVGGDRNDRGRAQAEEPQRPVDGVVAPLASEHPQRRRADQPGRLDVVAGAAEHLVPGGGEGGEVRHLSAGDEADRHLGREPEQLGQPAPGDLLDHAGGGAGDVQPGVLVPGGGEPVGGQRRRQRAADHEAEEAAARRRNQSRLGGRGQRRDHLAGLDGLLRQRPAERGPQLLQARAAAHRPFGQALQVGQRLLERLAQRPFQSGSSTTLPPHGGPWAWSIGLPYRPGRDRCRAVSWAGVCATV